MGVFLAALWTAGAASAAVGPAALGLRSLQISTVPGLVPAFKSSVTDYVTRCQPSDEVQVSILARPGVHVSVDNGPQLTGSFKRWVDLSAGQEFDVTSSEWNVSSTYHVRCLPSDFPTFRAEVRGSRQTAFYIVTPHRYPNPEGFSPQYTAFFDNNGVPVWWMKSSGTSIPEDGTLLPDGNVAWIHAWSAVGPGGEDEVGMEEHALDGSLVRTINTVGSEANQHDVQVMPNGNYLMGRTFPVEGVDLSACGGPAKGRLLDFELQELTPTDELVWSWLASDHLSLTEVPPDKPGCKNDGDAYHWNSVEVDGNSYVLSFRNLDAVYDIDAASGAINWKLGGTPTPESLAVVGDDYPRTLCGQHDARVLPDGTLTVFDDSTGCRGIPRGVRYTIDAATRTVTLIESVTNPLTRHAECCGSARRLPGGNWVMGWGETGLVTEQTETGATTFQLRFPRGWYTYRAIPVPPGQVSIEALRAGMDAQFPR
ncbi:MAG TPA: arylsulfotransferase family protein [Solirubrobacteraceae bacterium]|nr:arylsulfotransferase family protein [Solirubrobacteraceae bacterium]